MLSTEKRFALTRRQIIAQEEPGPCNYDPPQPRPAESKGAFTTFGQVKRDSNVLRQSGMVAGLDAPGPQAYTRKDGAFNIAPKVEPSSKFKQWAPHRFPMRVGDAGPGPASYSVSKPLLEPSSRPGPKCTWGGEKRLNIVEFSRRQGMDSSGGPGPTAYLPGAATTNVARQSAQDFDLFKQAGPGKSSTLRVRVQTSKNHARDVAKMRAATERGPTDACRFNGRGFGAGPRFEYKCREVTPGPGHYPEQPFLRPETGGGATVASCLKGPRAKTSRSSVFGGAERPSFLKALQMAGFAQRESMPGPGAYDPTPEACGAVAVGPRSTNVRTGYEPGSPKAVANRLGRLVKPLGKESVKKPISELTEEELVHNLFYAPPPVSYLEDLSQTMSPSATAPGALGRAEEEAATPSAAATTTTKKKKKKQLSRTAGPGRLGMTDDERALERRRRNVLKKATRLPKLKKRRRRRRKKSKSNTFSGLETLESMGSLEDYETSPLAAGSPSSPLAPVQVEMPQSPASPAPPVVAATAGPPQPSSPAQSPAHDEDWEEPSGDEGEEEKEA